LGIPVRADGGNRLRVRFSWFDLAYLALLVDWLPYMLEPLLVVPFAHSSWADGSTRCGLPRSTSVRAFVWITIAACVLRKPRLILLAPAVLALDLVYRVTMLHATVKAILQPRVTHCSWDSPTRFDTKTSPHKLRMTQGRST
jgi:hypothetical protein